MAWERLGWWSIVGGVVLAGLVDAVSIGTGSELAGYPNDLLVWASFHQFGYAWLDGRLVTVGRRLLLVGVGARRFVTVMLNAQIMAWFLWHLTAMVGVTSPLVALGGIGLACRR